MLIRGDIMALTNRQILDRLKAGETVLHKGQVLCGKFPGAVAKFEASVAAEDEAPSKAPSEEPPDGTTTADEAPSKAPETAEEEAPDAEADEEAAGFTPLSALSLEPHVLEMLEADEIETVEELESRLDTIEEIDGIGRQTAVKVRKAVEAYRGG